MGVANDAQEYVSVGDQVVNAGYSSYPSDGFYVHYDNNGYLGTPQTTYVIAISNGFITSIESFNDIMVDCNS